MAANDNVQAAFPLRLGRTHWMLISLTVASLCMNFVDRPLALASLDLAEPIIRLAGILSTISDPEIVLAVLGALAALSYPLQLAVDRHALPMRIQWTFSPLRWLFASTFLATFISLAIKFGLGRARPGYSDGFDPMVFVPFTLEAGYGSLPSTHCAVAGAFAITLAGFRPGLRKFLLLAGVYICLSRALLGEHWASDAVLGWTLGACVALVLGRTASTATPAAA